jgi:threonine synthase
VFLKDETRNPTGSLKDRALALAVTKAVQLDHDCSIVVSAGSTGISNAAFAAQAGLKSIVVVGESVPEERLQPLWMLGAEVISVEGEIDDVLAHSEEVAKEHGLYLSSTCRTSNPYQAEAAKTIAYEIVEQLGTSPDWVVVPVGGGGTIAAIARGFSDLLNLERIRSLPRLLGVVSRSHNTLEEAFLRMTEDSEQPFAFVPQEVPGGDDTVLVKIAHLYPPDGIEALRSVRQTDGMFVSVDDTDALDAQRAFGAAEGIYLEPSSATVLAGFNRARREHAIGPNELVVLVLSGSGFRETFATIGRSSTRRHRTSIEELADELVRAAGRDGR